MSAICWPPESDIWRFAGGLSRKQNAILQLVLLQQPPVFYGIKYAYLAMCFTTPYIACFGGGILGLHLYCSPEHGPWGWRSCRYTPIPPGENPFFWYWAKSIIRSGRSRRPNPNGSPSPNGDSTPASPSWVPSAAAKTSGCIYPFAEQILAYRARTKTPDRRARAGSQRRLLPKGPDHP